MPIGRPDWYNAGKSENIASLSDMAELAVRMGSIVSFDRTGKIILADDFTRLDGLYSLTGVGLSSAWALDTGIAETNGSSVKAVIGVGITNYAYIGKTIRTWGASQISLETSLYCNYVPNHFMLNLEQQQDNVRYQSRIDILNNSTDIYVTNSLGADVDTTHNFNNPFLKTMFYTIKIDMDYENLRYNRIRINDATYDLSSYGLYNIGSGLGNYIQFYLAIYGHASQALSVYCDRFIISEDE